jgi:hypothetical protein
MSMKEHEVKVRVPDMGLSPDQLEHLKQQFHNTIVGNMGGPKALAARSVVVVVVVVVVEQA